MVRTKRAMKAQSLRTVLAFYGPDESEVARAYESLAGGRPQTAPPLRPAVALVIGVVVRVDC